MNNNYAFIDGQNLHFGIKSLGWKLDHKKFRAYLEKEHGVTRAYIFLGFMEEHQDLYSVLQEAGFICYFKPLVRYDDGVIKGNVDADMVLQVMIDIENYDKAIIISGDGDFSGLIRHLIYKRKLGQMIIPNRDKYSSLYDRIEGFDSKHVTYMNDLKNKLQYNVGRRQPTAKRNPKPSIQTQPAKQKNQSPKKPKLVKPRRNSPKPSGYKAKAQSFAKNDFKPKSVLEQSLIDTINEK